MLSQPSGYVTQALSCALGFNAVWPGKNTRGSRPAAPTLRVFAQLLSLFAGDRFQVGLELIQQLRTALTGHLDEALFDLRRPLTESFNLLLVEAGDGDFTGGFLNLVQGLLGQAGDMLDDHLVGMLAGFTDQLLI